MILLDLLTFLFGVNFVEAFNKIRPSQFAKNETSASSQKAKK